MCLPLAALALAAGHDNWNLFRISFLHMTVPHAHACEHPWLLQPPSPALVPHCVDPGEPGGCCCYGVGHVLLVGLPQRPPLA
jgi:hypothetical protein